MLLDVEAHCTVTQAHGGQVLVECNCARLKVQKPLTLEEQRIMLDRHASRHCSAEKWTGFTCFVCHQNLFPEQMKRDEFGGPMGCTLQMLEQLDDTPINLCMAPQSKTRTLCAACRCAK